MRDTDADEKKKYVLKEICETERSFVLALKLICEEFYQAVHDHLSLEDSDLLFAIARVSYPLICGCAVGEGNKGEMFCYHNAVNVKRLTCSLPWAQVKRKGFIILLLVSLPQGSATRAPNPSGGV